MTSAHEIVRHTCIKYLVVLEVELQPEGEDQVVCDIRIAVVDPLGENLVTDIVPDTKLVGPEKSS